MASTGDSQLKSSMRCSKYMLLIINFMFSITAVLLVMVGSTIQAIFGDLRQFVDDNFLSPPALLIAIGFILLFVATLGAYGAIKESVMLINLYGVCLFLVFILEVSASVAAFVMQGQVSEMLLRNMNQSMADYEHNVNMQAGVNIMQSGLGCCGVNGPKDWLKYMNQTNKNTDDDILVPESCCGRFILDHKKQTCQNRYENGCYTNMQFIISQSAMLIGFGAIAVALVQFLGVICAFMLAKTLRHNKSIREARRWQLQRSLGVLLSGDKVDQSMNSPMTGYAHLESSSVTNASNNSSIIH